MKCGAPTSRLNSAGCQGISYGGRRRLMPGPIDLALDPTRVLQCRSNDQLPEQVDRCGRPGPRRSLNSCPAAMSRRCHRVIESGITDVPRSPAASARVANPAPPVDAVERPSVEAAYRLARARLAARSGSRHPSVRRLTGIMTLELPAYCQKYAVETDRFDFTRVSWPIRRAE
jgi:hypothetical protein